MKCILAKKIEMTQIFDNEGNAVPVTLVLAAGCDILKVKTKEIDGYTSIQLGLEPTKKKKKSKPGFRHVKEFRCEDLSSFKQGDKIDVSMFSEGDIVKVSGVSKGKGFQGGVKRWGFSGRNASHGVKHEQRTIGSIGGSTPGRVVKGRKMPGRAGSQRKTVKNLKVIKIDKDNNIIALKGAVPGRRGTLLEIRG